MRVGFPGGPRLEWYDRNPQLTRLAYNVGAVAPHAATTRATYTVPSGKKAIVTTVSLQVLRESAAAPVGLSGCLFGQAGGTSGTAYMLKNNVGDSQTLYLGTTALVAAGEDVTISSVDLSTGGTHRFSMFVSVVEFNA